MIRIIREFGSNVVSCMIDSDEIAELVCTYPLPNGDQPADEAVPTEGLADNQDDSEIEVVYKSGERTSISCPVGTRFEIRSAVFKSVREFEAGFFSAFAEERVGN